MRLGGAMGALPAHWPRGPWPPTGGGERHSREARVGNIPPVPLGHVLPDARGPLEVLVGLSTDLFGLSWETIVEYS